MKKKYKGIVLQGDKTGRTIGFPTVNLDPTILPAGFTEGVYACIVSVDNKRYRGTLFFGPRLVRREKHPVLEIYILDFDKEIYDQQIEFMIHQFIREVRHFDNLEELKNEINNDIKTSLKLLQKPLTRGNK